MSSEVRSIIQRKRGHFASGLVFSLGDFHPKGASTREWRGGGGGHRVLKGGGGERGVGVCVKACGRDGRGGRFGAVVVYLLILLSINFSTLRFLFILHFCCFWIRISSSSFREIS